MDLDIEEGKENRQIRARPQTVYGGFLPSFTPSAMPTNSPKLSVGNGNTGRKPGASSFKHKKKSLLTDFFNGLTFGGSGAAKKNGNSVVTDDVRCNKENQFQLDSSFASAVNCKNNMCTGFGFICFIVCLPLFVILISYLLTKMLTRVKFN